MKKYLIFSCLILCNLLKISAQTSKNKSVHYSSATIHSASPFHGTKHFCSSESKQTYTVTINDDSVLISYSSGNRTVKITGVFQKGLLFTNDPKELEYRHAAGKYNYGKYYIITATDFSVLNGENGEYSFYERCK